MLLVGPEAKVSIGNFLATLDRIKVPSFWLMCRRARMPSAESADSKPSTTRRERSVSAAFKMAEFSRS